MSAFVYNNKVINSTNYLLTFYFHPSDLSFGSRFNSTDVCAVSDDQNDGDNCHQNCIDIIAVKHWSEVDDEEPWEDAFSWDWEDFTSN